MASLAPTFGVPRIQLSEIDTSVTLDDLNAFVDTNLSALAWTKIKKNSPKKKLSGSYLTKVVELGYDETNNGFTFGRSTPDAAATVIAAGEGLLVNIANADFAANMAEAPLLGIFIAKGAGDYRLANLGYMDADNDFSYLVTGEPLLDAFTISGADLDAGTVLDAGGDKDPKGQTLTKKFRTVGGVRFNHRNESTRVDQDDAPAYDVPVARAVDLEFSIISNSLEDIMQLSGGDWVKYTDLNGDTIELGDSEIQAIISQLTGNKFIKAIYAPDKKGVQITKMFAGNIDISNAEFVENYQKLEQFRLDERLVAAPIDDVTAAVGTGISYKRYLP